MGGELSFIDGEFPVGVMRELILELGSCQISLDMYRRVLYCTARIADPAEAAAAQAGDTIRLVPGSTNRAIITAIPAEEAAEALSAQAGIPPAPQ